MPSERVQRRIDQLLDETEAAQASGDWVVVQDKSQEILDLDPENADATAFLAAARRRQQRIRDDLPSSSEAAGSLTAPVGEQPTSFANGRYTVTRFLGEGGKKKVYLARDSLLDRDVALALIKTEGLDEAARQRISREAQAMGRLGAHPNIVTVFDMGEEGGQPFLILPVMSGGDVEGLIEAAPEHRLPVERSLRIAIDTCLGLEFSHAKGIVHRDLKPGNVWLTEDGRAMIGDFGLAVAVDKSRLTQAGMMVGTVNYMPPEQAMGGEVGPRSDLYSLGAMIYEMVCGRPPFVGDESVAIIGQHLNTPPVAPSWHRPDCPPALEALILRLLEKDPTKRPASATEVREALESVTATATPRQPSVAQDLPAGDNPLYRRTFVGRENEVRQLQQAFDAALSGQGGLVMVVGEPGIGKTALCEQLATYVALRGGKALVGHCYEEGSLSLPYLAFVEAMRSYVLSREPDGLRSDLGTGAADVARIVSEVRDRVQGVELRPAGDPEDDRWRLLQAVTSFLRNASTVQPLCIVLEDLHWADRGTLDLLVHASRNLQGSRLLIVGTYRDVEVDRSHPLSGTLAELGRATSFNRVRLRGLTVDEVHRMYEAVRGQQTPWAQAEAVHRQTEGNPLFVQEVLRYLVEEGIVVREGGRWVRADGGEPGAGVPEGLRDVIGRRLSRLSVETNRVLAIAAVVGREFNLATVRTIAGADEDQLMVSLEEAVRVGVLEERGQLGGGVNYRFAHAFFRTTLYEELGAARRIRLHQQVAKALEELYGSRVGEHAAELADHFSHSSDRQDLAKAVSYGKAAAQRAMLVFDYGEAERLLERAIDVQEIVDPDDKAERYDLLTALGEAMLPQPDPVRILDTSAEEAFALAEAMGDRGRAARTAIQALEGIGRVGPARHVVPLRLWADRATQTSNEGSREQAMTEAYLGMLALQDSDQPGAHAHFRKAADLGRAFADSSLFFSAASYAFNYLNALQDRERRTSLTEEVLRRERVGIQHSHLALCLSSAQGRLLDRGERQQAELLQKELNELAERTHDATVDVFAVLLRNFYTFMDGKLEEARKGFESLGSGIWGIQARLAILLAQTHQGMTDNITITDSSFTGSGSGRGERAIRAYVSSLTGHPEEAREYRLSFGDVASPEDESHYLYLALILQTAIMDRDADFIRGLAPRFEPFADELLYIFSCGRMLGEAAIVLNDPAKARLCFDRSIALCQKLKYRPEMAMTRLDLAELLLEHYPDEHDAAIEHLDFAIAELRDMKMQAALERALRHRGLLKA